VQLALTSPEDTLVIGFNVTADDAALRLAEERGISLREYDIIYKLTDDVKAALEGRLKPVEEVVHLGRAVVRETFKISKVGTIAGCYVTSGTIERNARVRHPPGRGDLPAGRQGGRAGQPQAVQGRRQGGPRGLRVRHEDHRVRRREGR
jgi:translation initiation factor IF-2